MTIADMLEQSGVLALLGMGIVFSFLVILVFAITATGKIIGKFAKEEEAVPIPVPAQQGAVTAQGNNGAITAAITAAVNRYRQEN